MNKKEIIYEINRVKNLMGLNLITEGNILTQTTNFWKSLLLKNVDELLPEEKEIIESMIKNSSELATKQINTIDELLSPSGKNILKSLLKTDVMSLTNSLKAGIDNHYRLKINSLNNKLSGIQDFKNLIQSSPIGPKGTKTALGVLQEIGRNGVTRMDDNTLYGLISYLQKVKVNKNFVNNTKVQSYIDDVVLDIEDNLTMKSIDFESQAKSVDADESIAGKIGTSNAEEILKLQNELAQSKTIEDMLSVYKSRVDWDNLTSKDKRGFEEYVKVNKNKTPSQMSSEAELEFLSRVKNSTLTKEKQAKLFNRFKNMHWTLKVGTILGISGLFGVPVMYGLGWIGGKALSAADMSQFKEGFKGGLSKQNKDESLMDDFDSFKSYFEKLKGESPDWGKWTPNDKNSEGYYTLTTKIDGKLYTYKYSFENNQFVYKGE